MTHHSGHGADHAAMAAEPAHGSHGHQEQGHGHSAADGIEWEDDMVEINRLTTTANMHWKFVDRTTGRAAPAIDWRFTGRRPGQDPTGQRDGLRPPDAPPVPPARRRPLPRPGPRRRTEPNLVWKDTVLVRTGQTVDILFDVTNPGLWMAHCHIAEHMQSGMMFSFTVDRRSGTMTGANTRH